MPLTVLNVAFPFAPVDEDPVGGAEQVLAALDRALVAQGHRSIVIAAAGSRTCGELVSFRSDTHARAETHRAVRAAIDEVLTRRRIDLMHFHGTDFIDYLPPHGPAALVSLHLPLDWYPAHALQPRRPLVWLQPVSASQASRAERDLGFLPPIENGVDVAAFPRLRKRRYAIVLGRVCAEKGFHDAIEACKRAGVALLAAGQVFGWPEHRRYFEGEVLPRLDRERRFIGPVGGRRKRRLLAAARCLLVPSRAQETSSLVAMEALAAGTPVIAFRSGALPDIVEHGRTGFVVDNAAQMAAAIGRVATIDPQACRRAARERFPQERMVAAYLARYAQLAGCTGATGTQCGHVPLSGG
ncbi:MAG TPA: glycosyltransferase [Rudaea sp.]|nr:glycosyltransferase [Rudaea sp.]